MRLVVPKPTTTTSSSSCVFGCMITSSHPSLVTVSSCSTKPTNRKISVWGASPVKVKLNSPFSFVATPFIGRLFSMIVTPGRGPSRSEEHTSELQSLMRNSYAVFCLKKKNKNHEYNKLHHLT